MTNWLNRRDVRVYIAMFSGVINVRALADLNNANISDSEWFLLVLVSSVCLRIFIWAVMPPEKVDPDE